jgi:hypothetical protein
MKQRVTHGPVHIDTLRRLNGAALERMSRRSDWPVLEAFWRRQNEEANVEFAGEVQP